MCNDMYMIIFCKSFSYFYSPQISLICPPRRPPFQILFPPSSLLKLETEDPQMKSLARLSIIESEIKLFKV